MDETHQTTRHTVSITVQIGPVNAATMNRALSKTG
jgi:hypothetical protein